MTRPAPAPARVLLVLAVAGALAAGAAAGCASGDDGEAAASPTADVGEPFTTGSVAEGDRGFCSAFGLLLVGPLSGEDLDVSDPAALGAAVDDTALAVELLRQSAPTDIADAVVAVADAYDAAFAALAAHGYDLARFDAEATAEEREAFESLGRPPAGPGIVDPWAVVEDAFGERCAAGVELPDELLGTSTSAGGDG